ncbi:MAG: hypothetical protein EPO11_10710 [Gammaproteobacteria bacterium]|nr:MAG: hypothetical protein EPO11_10710 [Gammaproteobacteria bacterium]
MLSNKPYLLRAFYQWIVDSTCTPILVVDATHPRCKIPQGFAEGGEIVFNISPAAVRDFKIVSEQVEFKASFSGIVHIIAAPIKAILAIYAEENSEGIFFDAEDDEEGDEGSNIGTVQLKGIEGMVSDNVAPIVNTEEGVKGKPFLKLVE